MSSSDLRAEGFGIANARFAFDVDQNKMILATGEKVDSLDDAKSGVYFKAGVAKDLIAQGTQHLPPTDMKDYGGTGLDGFHYPLIIDY